MPAPHTLAQAESLASTPSTAARDRALTDWARKASANDLAWMLRLTPVELGGAEAGLLDAAIANTPPSRSSLRQRWLARRLLVPSHAHKGDPVVPDLAALRPFASVFRVAVILPDSGEYAVYGSTVRAAFRAGLARGRARDALPIAIDSLGTHDSDPARVSAAFVDAAQRSDVIVGELLSGPTAALATAATAAGMTLVSPTATDDRIGRIGPGVFRVGPAAASRARRLADAVLGHDAHAVAILGSPAGIQGAFADAFAAEVTARGGRVVRREAVRASAADLSQQAKSLKASGADVLFWDGAARDAESLVRALATAGASMRVCGTPTLAPEGMRSNVRALLEGVTWVAEEWRLPAEVRAYVDSLPAPGLLRSSALRIRGFLAGRVVAAAIDAGARTASEVADRLRHHDAALAAAGLLECEREGATLPVFEVRKGKAVEVAADRQ